MLHLSYAHSQRSFGEFTASEKWQLVRFQDRSFGAAPNSSCLGANKLCFLHCVTAPWAKRTQTGCFRGDLKLEYFESP